MAHKENQRIVLTRKLLQEGLLRLLSTQKLDQISVTALCKESGINRATFYNHYSSPIQLLQEMEEALINELLRLHPPTNDIETIVDQVERSCAFLKENATTFEILVRYHADRGLEKMFFNVTQHYTSHRADMANKKLDDDSVRLVSAYLYAGCYALLREWLLNDVNKTPREIAELLVDIINKNYL